MRFSGILVTGSEGFIGTHLKAQLMRQGSRFKTLSRHGGKGVEFAGDLRDQRFAMEACKGMELILHLAGSSAPFPNEKEVQSDFEANALGTLNLLRAAEKQGVEKVVFTSSAMVYGKQRSPLKESAALEPVSHYGLSKLLAEECCRFYSRRGLQVVIARLFNAFGPGQKNRVIPDLIQRMKDSDGAVAIRGNAADMRDFLSVEQVVQGLLLLSEKGNAGEAYNLASGKGTRILEVAQLLLEAFKARNKSFGAHLQYEFDERTAYAMYADVSKMRRLGFSPEPLDVKRLRSLI